MAKKVKDYLVYLLVRVFVCVVQAMSMETCARLAKALAYLASDILRIRHKVTEENLKRVYPDWGPIQRRRVTRRMWEHLTLMVFEIAHVPRKIHETNWRDYINMSDRPRMVRYLLDERPVVFVSGHFGNFEVAAYTTGLLGFATNAIARPLDNPYLDRFINRFRETTRQFVLPKQGSGGAVQKVLETGGTLLFLGDQYAGPKGCWVDFMGHPASCHKAIAVLTLTGGAPLLVCSARRGSAPLHFEIGIEGVADPEDLDDSIRGVRQLTQWYNDVLEGIVRATPDQYWWLHRRWKGQPLKRRKKKRKKKTQPPADAAHAARQEDGPSRHVA